MSSVRAWLDLAEGPLFRFAFMLMVLGLIRLVILSIWSFRKMKSRTRDQSSDLGALIRANLRWLRPWRWLRDTRPSYTATSVVFHIGLILVPIFFLPHITLWRPERGFGWFPALPFHAADALTALTILTGAALVVMRAADRGSRRLSQLQDWALTPLCVLIFLTGYLAAHPAHNPFGYNGVRLVHVLSGDLLLILIPFTKLAHVVLLPFTNALSDLSWKLVPGVGEKVRVGLGHQNKPV